MIWNKGKKKKKNSRIPFFFSLIIHRDVYGFKKPTQYVDIERIEEIEQQNELIMEKQRKRWQKLSANTDVQWPAKCHQCKFFYAVSLYIC